jgi:hypothetical protein
MRSFNTQLQQKLDTLAAFCATGDRKSFVKAFVPLDLTPDETAGYLADLTGNDDEWESLSREIQAIADGGTVVKILGDQTKKAVFFFPHPTISGCDREVSFVCSEGEWRAEG